MRIISTMLASLLLVGCLATENRKVAVTHRQSDGNVASVDTVTFWWRVPYYANRKDHPMDSFIPPSDRPWKQDAVEADMLFFSKNVVRWPTMLRTPYKSSSVWITPAPKQSKTHFLSEVY